jgi:hypothetical protein
MHTRTHEVKKLGGVRWISCQMRCQYYISMWKSLHIPSYFNLHFYRSLSFVCFTIILVFIQWKAFCIELPKVTNKRNTPYKTTRCYYITPCYIFQFARTIIRLILVQQFTKHKNISACNSSVGEISLNLGYLLK